MLGKQSKLRYEGPGQKSLMGTVKRRKSEPKNKKGKKTKQEHSRTATIRDLGGQRAWM